MKKLILKSFVLVSVVGWMTLSGCTFQSKPTQEESKPAVPAKLEPTPAVAVPAIPVKPKKPDVEIITPTAAQQPQLTVEPIPEQTKPEQPTDEPTTKQPATQSQQDSKAKEQTIPPAKPADKPVTSEQPADKSATKPIPVSSGPDHLVVTAVTKDSTHPHFNKGHKMGFAINGEQGKDVVIERSKSYRFEIVTNPKHDVYLSTKEIGWGANPWSDGVQGAFVYNGMITVNLDKKAPSLLYYSCRNHPYMGGKIHVVNPGEKVVIKKNNPKPTSKSVRAPQVTVNAAVVNQKLMFAQMLMGSKSTKSMPAEKRASVDGLVAQAKKDLKAGNHQQAFTAAEKALAMLKNKKVQGTAGVKDNEKHKEEYKELLASLKNFEQSHAENYKRIAKSGKSKVVEYDKKSTENLKKEATTAVKRGDYVSANKKLHQAQNMVTKAIQAMLNSTTIVYDLNFETPQEEYDYELKRFGGYEELIPVAVEAKKPAPGAKKLMETYLEKGRKMRAAAIKKAASGDYPVAIAMLLDATKEVRRALRMVGVMQ